MTIETKFNWQEKVWLLDVNSRKAIEMKVYEIMINCYSYNPTINYKLNQSNGMILPEDKLFKTKEELLASL